MTGKTLGDSILTGGIEGLVISFLHSFGDSVGKHIEKEGGEYLKSKIFGAGTNDEHLFLSACAYALDKGMLTSDKLLEVCQVIDSYPPSQRSRVINTLGKTEDDVVTEGSTKASYKANVRGAQMLAMLAKLDKKGMKKILNASGASVGFMNGMKKTTKKMAEKIGNSQVRKDGETFLTKKTWLEKFAEQKCLI